MKLKQILVAAVLVFAGAAFAVDTPSVSTQTANAAPAKFSDAMLARTDTIERGIMDLEALFWSWRISVMQDAELAKLDEYARNWPVKDATRAEIIAKIKAHIAKGDARPLTLAENKKYAAAKSEIRAIIFSGK